MSSAKTKTKRFGIGLLFILLLAVGAPQKSSFADDVVLEKPRARQGYYVGVGGYAVGSVSWDADKERLGPWPGVTGGLRLGQALAPWIDLGLHISGGRAFGGDFDATLFRLSLEAQLHPWRDLAVRLGIGAGATDVYPTRSGVEDDVIGRFGDNYILAVAWDFFPFHKGGSGGFALTPVVGAQVGPGGDFTTLNGFIGVEITWWSGLSKDQLELSPEEAFQ